MSISPVDSRSLCFSRFLLGLALSVIGISAASARPHAPFEAAGIVVKIHDGDTIKLQTEDRGVINIRLSGADTPETGQAYWRLSRNYLRTLVRGMETRAWCYKTDRYEREVCHVFVGQADVGLKLIQEGLAWYARTYASELTETQRANYELAEQEARQHAIGLWAETNPMAPWECRMLRRSAGKCR